MKIIFEDELTAADLVPSEFDVWVHKHDPSRPHITKVTVNRGTYLQTVFLEDTTALVAANTAASNAFSPTSRHDGWVRVASLPSTLGAKMRSEEWEEADVKRFLNDPDNAKFRTTTNWRV